MVRKRKCKPPRVFVERVRVNRHGYDSRGSYWGVGEPLYRISTADGGFDTHIRARDAKTARTKAKAAVAARYCGGGSMFEGLRGLTATRREPPGLEGLDGLAAMRRALSGGGLGDGVAALEARSGESFGPPASDVRTRIEDLGRRLRG